jgi:hypothetical protein
MRISTVMIDQYVYIYIDYIYSRIAHQQDCSCNRFQQLFFLRNNRFQQLESERAQKAFMFISPLARPVRMQRSTATVWAGLIAPTSVGPFPTRARESKAPIPTRGCSERGFKRNREGTRRPPRIRPVSMGFHGVFYAH